MPNQPQTQAELLVDFADNTSNAITAQDVRDLVVSTLHTLPAASSENTITNQAANVVGLTVQGASSQSADLVELQNSNGSVLAKFDSSGNLTTTTVTAALVGNATTATTATNFSGSLAGDVTGTQSATVVALVDGSTAANVHAAELLANAATSANTASTIVKRDGSGNFTAGTITAALSGNATTATTATNLSGSITESQVTNLTGDLAAKAIAARNVNTTAPITGGGDLTADRTIVIPKATGSVDGYLAAADFATFAAKGSGSVTSVGLSLPSILSVTGSPVTTSGTISGTLATQVSNSVFAGPSSGAAAAPTFRALTAADVPGLSYVTSVGLSAPAFLSVTGSPVTSNGTLSLALATETSNTIFAGPSSGAAAAPTFRALAVADIPALPISVITSGQLPISLGGTGASTANLALNALLPAQTSDSGKVLQTDGTNTSWQTVSGGSGSYVSIAPSTTATNIIQATLSNVIPLTVKTISATTVDLTEWLNSSGTVLTKVTNTGQLGVGLGSTAATASVHIAAGSTAASSAPIKLTAGSVMTSAEAGAIEYDGSFLYYTDGSPSRHKLQNNDTAGTVTSVGLNLPAMFSVTGSPVTTSGTLSGTLQTQTSNTIFAGPSSGAAAAPTFRGLVAADIPAGFASGTFVSIAPSTTATNTIQATLSNIIPLTVKTISATTVDLTEWLNSSGTVLTKVTNTGQLGVGLGSTVATASVHIAAGSTAASSAPIKIAAGSVMTSTEVGAIEFDGNYLYYTDNAPTRHTIKAVNVQTIAYASTITPVGTNPTCVVDIGTLTANVSFAAPSGTASNGNELTFRLVQDGTGGRTLTWNSAYAFGTDIVASNIVTTANAKQEAKFVYNGTDSTWRCLALARGF